jgi:hypothetical protein
MKLVLSILISNLMVVSSFAQSKSVEISHYIFPEFTQGVVLMKSGEKVKTLLNYNSLTEEMIYIDNGTKLAIVDKSLASIDTVFIRDKKFIPVKNKFYESIYHSKFDLYIEHKCFVNFPGKPAAYGGTSQTSSSTSYSSIFSEGVKLELKLPDGYEVQPYSCYWIKKNEAYKMFKNLRQLKNLYSTKKELFNAYVKEHNVEYDHQESIIRFIEYLESN